MRVDRLQHTQKEKRLKIKKIIVQNKLATNRTINRHQHLEDNKDEILLVDAKSIEKVKEIIKENTVIC